MWSIIIAILAYLLIMGDDSNPYNPENPNNDRWTWPY
jgi:hypothetical protein